MRIVQEFDSRLIEQLFELYQAEWWTKGRTLAETQSCVEQSQISIGIVNDRGDLRGFARVITDFTFKALIFDVIVTNRYRGEGLGELLMKSIQSHPQLRGVKHFELYCLPELERYYERIGFSADVGGIRLMRLHKV